MQADEEKVGQYLLGLGQMGAVGVQIHCLGPVSALLEEFGQSQGDQGAEHR